MRFSTLYLQGQDEAGDGDGEGDGGEDEEKEVSVITVVCYPIGLFLVLHSLVSRPFLVFPMFPPGVLREAGYR